MLICEFIIAGISELDNSAAFRRRAGKDGARRNNLPARTFGGRPFENKRKTKDGSANCKQSVGRDAAQR